jgi:pimeloyl-ACP methyl ester carboxylesterase
MNAAMNTSGKQVTQTNLQLNDAERDYWRTYHDEDVLARADALRKSYAVPSTGVLLNVDAYEQDNPDAPVFIFNHGGGGYSRLFIPLGLALYNKGYTVLFPDQRGQGFSEGSRRDFTMGQFVQNVVDVAHWARAKYAGMLYMGGGSLGGALTCKAVASGAPVKAMICHNLYDFGKPSDTLAVSSFSLFADLPIIPQLFSLVTRTLGTLLPFIPVPYQQLGRFDKMVDARNTDFYPKYQRDPYPIKWITLRYMASNFSTPPAIALEDNDVPVLVINQTRDEMVSPVVTKRNYERLGGRKAYAEIDYGHWAMGGDFEREWVTLVHDFLLSLDGAH